MNETHSRIEDIQMVLHQADKDSLSCLISNMPSLRTQEEIDDLRDQGYPFDDFVGVRNLQPHSDKLELANKVLVQEVQQILSLQQDDEIRAQYLQVCQDSSRVILDLLVKPPSKIDICSRNPKEEYPRLARILLSSTLTGNPLPFVVPVCPDSYQYKLRDGIGEIGLKALGAIQRVNDFMKSRGITSCFDIHLADVEGLDSAILEASGETTDTHFAKTRETRRKIEQEVGRRGLYGVTVRSMNEQFENCGLEYLYMQEMATTNILNSNQKNVKRVIEQLMLERNRLRNFEGMTEVQQKRMVSRELAGYAAYGQLIHGQAIILSPDAMSAIPAYHFGEPDEHLFSPVFYAK